MNMSEKTTNPVWHVAQSAVRGRGHVKTGIPCQDKTCTLLCNGVRATALADGAGSAKLSHFGAEAVTHWICETLTEHFDAIIGDPDAASIRRQFAAGLYLRLGEVAKEQGCDVKSLASTLLAVAVKDDRFLMVHIGDGVIGWLKNGQLQTISAPTNGEFANVTYFTTSSEAVCRMKLAKGSLQGVQGFVLMSDGTEAGMYSRRRNCLAPVLKNILGLAALLPGEVVSAQLERSLESVSRLRTSDDCSLALMVCPSALPGYDSLTLRERCRLLGVMSGYPCTGGCVRRYETLLRFLQTPRTLRETVRHLHVKAGAVAKRLRRMEAAGLTVRTDGYFRSQLTMDATETPDS